MTHRDESIWTKRELITTKGKKELDQKYGEVVSELLLQRGIKIKDTEKFFSPSLEDIPSHEFLYDSKSAAEKIVISAKEGKKIYIHGDYDADGICATTILWNFLYRELPEYIDKKVDVLPYIPDRSAEGYGLSRSSIEQMINGGAQLVITVDCGVRDSEIIREYMGKGVDFIVTDHHQPPENIQENLEHILVHPMYPDHEYPELSISGSFVSFLLVQAIRDKLGQNSKISLETPMLELAAFSTITDMMPMVGVNRNLVASALPLLRNSKNQGVKKLIEVSGLEGTDIDSYHVGYVLGPRINASGRIGTPIEAVRLLSTKDSNIATKIAADLDALNKDRQGLTEEILNFAQGNINESDRLIFIIGEDWAEGIIGLVAGKLLEKYSKPVIVATRIGDEVRGSARSIIGFNITDHISKFSDLLVKYGGHAQAAGFSMESKNLDEFKKKLVTAANKSEVLKDLKISKVYDLELTTDQLDLELVDTLERFKPFGEGNPRPLIYLPDLLVTEKKVMGSRSDHLKIEVKSGLKRINALIFGGMEDIAEISVGDRIELLGNPNINVWNGNSELQFIVKCWRSN